MAHNYNFGNQPNNERYGMARFLLAGCIYQYLFCVGGMVEESNSDIAYYYYGGVEVGLVTKGLEHQLHVHTGMTNRATACIRAFWGLDMVILEVQRTPDLWTSGFPGLGQHTSKELSSIEFWTRRPFDPTYSVEPVTMWSLPLIAANSLPETVLETFLENFNLIPSGSEIDDKLIYADFLFSLVSFFHPTTARDRSVRPYIELLMTLLFESLTKRCTDIHPLDTSIANNIVITVAKLNSHFALQPLEPYHGKMTLRCSMAPPAKISHWWLPQPSDVIFGRRSHQTTQRHSAIGWLQWLHRKLSNTVGSFFQVYDERNPQCITAMYCFCALPGVSQEAIASVLRLLRLDYPWSWERGCIAHIDLPISPGTEPILHLQCVLLSILSVDETHPTFDKREAGCIAYFACGILDSEPAAHWFADNELPQTLKQHSVWANLGWWSSSNQFYLSLGHKLSGETKWKNIIAADLPGWLGQWPNIMLPSRHLSGKEITEGDRTQFRAVLSRVWDVDETEANEFGAEATLVMVFSALIKTWDQVRPVDWGIKQVWYHIKLLDSTVVAAFSARIQSERILVPSQRFQDIMITRLRQLLLQAGESIKQDNSGNLKDIVEDLANLVLRVGAEVPGQLRTPPPPGMDLKAGEDWRYWDDLRENWLKEVSVLRYRFEEVSKSLNMQQGDSAGETA
ncbi:hypothetical protein DFH08DRAFT_814972 [Mycena albidolilacea]|uniref:Uncharacterized protein n=1 Tax=Mycena albidolilacea TaxID=1033008 RepID=A0AAD6ZND6_9AGAR|nr:hypothetical protein DFH08DRAFT_814972 [Mycena albidolilacea]